MKIISDTALIQSLLSKVENVLDPPWHLESAWLRRENWLAVPVEKGRHFEEPAAETVSRALQDIGCNECFAVATELMGGYPSAYTLPPTKEELIALSVECAGVNFALIDENLAFTILCTTEDYNLVAGPPDFVETAVGMDIKTARRAFRHFASDEWWEGRLLEVADRYEQPS